MPYAGTGPFRLHTDAGDGANNARLSTALVGAENNTTIVDWGTDSTFDWLQLRSLTTTSGTGVASPPAAAQTDGWNILESDMDPTTDLPAKRTIPAGDVLVDLFVGFSVADATAANGDYKLHARLYKRKTDGTYSAVLASANRDLTTLEVSTVFTVYTVTVNLASEVVLENDETLHLELWARGRGVVVTGRTVTLRLATVAGNASEVTLPGSGLRYRYPRDFTGAATPSGTKTFSPNGVILRRTGTITPGPGTRKTLVSLFRTGAITPAGAKILQPRTAHEGSLTPSGLLLKQPGLVKAGTVTPGPSTIVKQARLVRAGTVTPASTVGKFISTSEAGSITPAGAVTKRYQPLPYTASISPGPGSLLRRPGKLLTATITPTATVQALLRKNFVASITPTGVLTKTLFLDFVASIIPVGTLAKQTRKFFTGFLGPGEGGGPPTVIKKIVLAVFDD